MCVFLTLKENNSLIDYLYCTGICRFATRERNALLLYNGRFNEKHDFIAVEIVDEQIQLSFSGGKCVCVCSFCVCVCDDGSK